MPLIPPPTRVKRSTSAQPVSHPSQLCPQSIIDLTTSGDDDDNSDEDFNGIRYPTIPAMLAELKHEYPGLGFGQYEGVLVENGFAYVSQLVEGQV